MNFSKLRHRIIFLRPTDETENSMGETVPRYKPFKPYLPLPLQLEGGRVFLSHDDDGNAVLIDEDGQQIARKLALKDYSVAALVAPMSGREYEESQKLRAETTYKISTRYFRCIKPEHRILYVLDLGGKHDELQIIAAEHDSKTAQTFDSGDYDG